MEFGFVSAGVLGAGAPPPPPPPGLPRARAHTQGSRAVRIDTLKGFQKHVHMSPQTHVRVSALRGGTVLVNGSRSGGVGGGVSGGSVSDNATDGIDGTDGH